MLCFLTALVRTVRKMLNIISDRGDCLRFFSRFLMATLSEEIDIISSSVRIYDLFVFYFWFSLFGGNV